MSLDDMSVDDDGMGDDAGSEPLLTVSGLRKAFPLRGRAGRAVRAVDGIDLEIGRSETLGLVGESGSGKSTTGRLILRLIDPDEGTIRFEGRDVMAAEGSELRDLRRDMQIVFQDPYSSLDPLAPIASVVGEPFEVHHKLPRRTRDERVVELLEKVGLSATHLYRYPAEFSGGQRQRIAIARALALNPKLIVCDEPVSALDMSTQAQVINLLADLQDEHGLAYLLIAHDLAVVRHASNRIAVMYLGRIVEVGEADLLHREPKHPYTEALLSAAPVPDPAAQRTRKRIVLWGDIPSPVDPPGGCRFHTRCPYAMEICAEVDPDPFPVAGGWSACHLHVHGPKLAGAAVSGLPVAATPIAVPKLAHRTRGRTADATDRVVADR
jgi:oligopeptide/dipeptide ABC transporter ATP-binding protein